MAIFLGGLANTFIDVNKIIDPDVTLLHDNTSVINSDNRTISAQEQSILSNATTEAMEKFNRNVIDYSLYYVYMGIFVLFSAYVQVCLKQFML